MTTFSIAKTHHNASCVIKSFVLMMRVISLFKSCKELTSGTRTTKYRAPGWLSH